MNAITNKKTEFHLALFNLLHSTEHRLFRNFESWQEYLTYFWENLCLWHCKGSLHLALKLVLRAWIEGKNSADESKDSGCRKFRGTRHFRMPVTSPDNNRNVDGRDKRKDATSTTTGARNRLSKPAARRLVSSSWLERDQLIRRLVRTAKERVKLEYHAPPCRIAELPTPPHHPTLPTQLWGMLHTFYFFFK